MSPIPGAITPPGWTNHGDPDLVCIPAKWTAVLLFYFANYIAHCATVKPYPAETSVEIALAMALALFLPSSGITRAMDSLIRRSRLRNLNKLERAAKAGALCMVVRTKDWQPRVGDVLKHLCQAGDRASELDPPSRDGDITDDGRTFEYLVCSPPWLKDKIQTGQTGRRIMARRCEVHGIHRLPKGYELAYVPSDAVVKPHISEDAAGGLDLIYEVSSSYSFTKAAVAIVQTVYASITLYRARGDQIRIYGYAAFGLTVIPYILMSILNLFGQIATPDYPALYLVHSEEMEEARRRGGWFDGVIGTLHTSETAEESNFDPYPSAAEGPWVVEDMGRDARLILRNTYTESRPSQSEKHPRTIKIREKFPGDYSQMQTVYIPCCSRFDCRNDRGRRWNKKTTARRRSTFSFTLLILAPVLFGCLSILIVGLLSRFRKGQSTKLQRGFTVSWLIVGMLFGALSKAMSKFLLHAYGVSSALRRAAVFAILFGVFLVPAIGGFVVVGEMIVDYGTCTRVD